MDKDALIKLLKSEITLSMGCTDPGAVCMAVSRAVYELGRKPEQIFVTVSPNIFKNGINVRVPGTGMRGLPIAAALGAVMKTGRFDLMMLENIDSRSIGEAADMVARGAVVVQYIDTPHPVYIKAIVTYGPDRAHAIIASDYNNIVEVGINDRIVESVTDTPGENNDALKTCDLRELFSTMEVLTVEDLAFLIEAAEVNQQAALYGLGTPTSRLGSALNTHLYNLPHPFASAALAQMLTASACEARMSGVSVRISAITGSGNHGITSFVGIRAVAEIEQSNAEKYARALAISAMVTILIKMHAHRVSAFCGCAVAAAAGVAAGTVYLLGGDYDDSVHAMQSVIGTLAGMVCDGAKESCAYKLSASASLAVQYGYMAMNGAYIPACMGIVGETIEDTFCNLGRLNYPGMEQTDRLLLHMIKDNVAFP